MKLFRKRILKLGNKGLSMVELICGITMLTIVGASISSVLVVSANTYNRGSSESGVQQEAQLVANQISDLIIDSTANVKYEGNTLTIEQDGVTHKVVYKDDEDALYYTKGGAEQLMAEGVTDFDVNLDGFETYGYAGLDIKFEKAGQEYPASYTIMSRNKETSDPAVVASVTMETDWLLEPFQNHTFVPNVTSTNPTTGSWAIRNNTSSTTKIENGKVTIGQDETANVIRVVYTAKDTVTGAEIANKYANVYVRRATNISVNGVYDPTCGAADEKAGSKYNLTAVVSGNFLDKMTGKSYDDDYVDAKSVYWTVSTDGSSNPTLASSTGTTNVLTLGGDMDENETITVTVRAMHADGTNPADPTAKTNKTGGDYGEVTNTWTKVSAFSPFTPEGGWLRETDLAQASVDVNYLNTLTSTLGGANWEIQSRYVTKEGQGVTVDSGWLDNEYGGDANGSSVVNIRPLITKMLDPMLSYYIHIRVVIKNDAGEIIYPTATTPEKAYMMTGEMAAVDMSFKSDVINIPAGSTMNTESEALIGCNVDMSGSVQKEILRLDQVQGVEKDRVTNETKFILEKKVGDEYLPVEEAMPNTAEMQSSQGALKLKFDQNKTAVQDGTYKGLYRVKVVVTDRKTYSLGADNSLVEDPTKIEWQLWDESGDGMFYFNIK